MFEKLLLKEVFLGWRRINISPEEEPKTSAKQKF